MFTLLFFLWYNIHICTFKHDTAVLRFYHLKTVKFIPIMCCSFFQLPHHAVFREHFKFLKAHEAEGLLGVCIFLIKVIITLKY